MERTPELFEKIDTYLNGNLEGNELAYFERSILDSPKLSEEVEKYKLIKNTLSDTETIRFRRKIEQIHKEIEDDKTKTKPAFGNYWKVAAVFIGLIGLSSLLWLQNPIKKDLFSTYYVPYPMDETTIGSSLDITLKEVTHNYKNKDYFKTIPNLKQLIEKETDNTELALYLGNSYLNTGQENEAILLFKGINEDSLFYKDAQWFLALSHLKLKQNEQAILVLEKLVSMESMYKNKALKLLENLSE